MSKESVTQIKKLIPKAYKRRRYYIKKQVELHCTANDIWVIFFDDVLDLTQFVQKNRENQLSQPLIKAAGSDITEWFDSKTQQPRKFINQKGQEQFHAPKGKFLHLDKTADVMTIPWWKDQNYVIGKLTKKSQMIRIINTLSDTQDLLQVPSEQTINQILDRYQQINCHAKSYTWKRKGQVIDMGLNLADNGIVDQTDMYEQLQVPAEERYIPAIHVHFNDDLTSM